MQRAHPSADVLSLPSDCRSHCSTKLAEGEELRSTFSTYFRCMTSRSAVPTGAAAGGTAAGHSARRYNAGRVSLPKVSKLKSDFGRYPRTWKAGAVSYANSSY